MLKIKKPNIKFKFPSINFNFKKGLKIMGRIFMGLLTTLFVGLGSLGLFLSYTNPVPSIAEQFPNLYLGYYNLETLFNDIKWWQSLGYIPYVASSGAIVLGFAIHIRSIGNLWKGIKSTPGAIWRLPVASYKKLRAGRDWLLEKIEYLNNESKKWRTAFNIAKSPYTLLRALGFSPQMAVGLLTVSSTVGGGVIINETVLADRTFENGDPGYYNSNNVTGNINIPDETLEQALERADSDNTLRVIVGTLPIAEVSIQNVSIGTAYNSSTLPSGKTEAILVEGTNAGGVSTYLEVGELIFERNRCKQLIVENVTAHTIEIVGNLSDGQSITQSAGTGIRRAIIGGHFQSKSLKTDYGLYDRIHLSADTNNVNGQIGRLVMSNIVSKGGTCNIKRVKADKVVISHNRIGAGDGFGTKDFKIEASVNAVHWVVDDNAELLTSEPASLPTE
tara:strand:+ start:486 stop:1826 length:1341 start_codon:yes stop_codon:yes gene_type:complete